MRNNSHAERIEHTIICRLIDYLLSLFMRGKLLVDKIKKLQEKKVAIDNANQDYALIKEDHRESNKMFLFIIIAVLSVLLDFILIANPVAFIAKNFHLPYILIFVIPAVLVILEIGIAYTSILHHRTDEPRSWIGRNLQYFVIGLLIAMSVLLLIYFAQGYEKTTDGAFIPFLLGHMFIQIILLIPAIMIHLWVVRHSEDIAEAVAFLRYLLQQKKVQNKINKYEKEYQEHLLPKYIKGTRTFVYKKERYEANYGDGGFEKMVPRDLAESINKIMGRMIFSFKPKAYEEIN
jgi:hypothetical protein